MKILYIYPFGPFYPISSGADIIASNHMEYFKKKNALVDCILFHNYQKETYFEQFKQKYSFCRSFYHLKYPPISFKFGELLFASSFLAKSEPLKSLLNNQYDIVFTNYVFTAPISHSAKKTHLKILEAHDHLWEAFSISNQNNFNNSINITLMKKFEFELYQIFKKIIFINKDEMSETPPKKNIDYAFIPPAWNLVSNNSSDNHNFNIDILFIGSHHRPNIDGLDFFYKNVFLPFIRPLGFTVTVVGKVCDYWQVDDPRVKKMGFFNGSTNSLYNSSKVVIIPILEGSGLSIKTLEAMAFGKAIVTTPKGTRGMRIEGQPFLTVNLRDQPYYFASAIIELLNSPEKRNSLGQKAMEHFKNEHSFEVYSQRLDNFLGIV